MNSNNTLSNLQLKERIHHIKWRILKSDYTKLQWIHCTLAQYRICVWVLSEYFSSIPNQSWETLWDGVGMCRNNDWEFENRIIGWSQIDRVLQESKQKVLDEIELSIFDPWHKACIYHREGVGCILWDLKSPRCAIEPDGDVRDTYNPNKLKYMLETIQLAGATEENMFQESSPEKNWDIVTEFLEEIESYL